MLYEVITKLENMILEIKKRISGVVVKDADENLEAGISKDSLSRNNFV